MLSSEWFTNMYDTYCYWCNRSIPRGEWINKFLLGEFSGYIRQLVSRVSFKNQIPIEVSVLISSYLFTSLNYKQSERQSENLCYYCSC